MPANPTTKKRTFKEVKVEFLVLKKVGETCEGSLIEKGTMQFRAKDGDGNFIQNPDGTYQLLPPVGRYTFQRDDHSFFGFLGSVRSDSVLKDLALNSYVRITYIGLVDGTQIKDYKIEVAE